MKPNPDKTKAKPIGKIVGFPSLIALIKTGSSCMLPTVGFNVAFDQIQDMSVVFNIIYFEFVEWEHYSNQD
jgi:hypothetical protein